jgi:hypothetical protein
MVFRARLHGEINMSTCWMWCVCTAHVPVLVDSMSSVGCGCPRLNVCLLTLVPTRDWSMECAQQNATTNGVRLARDGVDFEWPVWKESEYENALLGCASNIANVLHSICVIRSSISFLEVTYLHRHEDICSLKSLSGSVCRSSYQYAIRFELGYTT